MCGITWVDAAGNGPSCYSLLVLVNFLAGKPISCKVLRNNQWRKILGHNLPASHDRQHWQNNLFEP
jgi:hypothetical protein